MSTERPVFMRPFEVGDDNTSWFTVDVGGTVGTATTTAGVYTNAYNVASTVLAGVRANVSGVVNAADITAEITDDLEIKFSNAASADVVITWSYGALQNLMGFTSSTTTIPAGSSVTATWHLGNTWLPTYCRYDQGSWHVNPGDLFSGTFAQDGAVAGTTTGQSIYFRDFAFPHEPAANLFVSRGSAALEQFRCLEYFSLYARTSLPHDSTYPTTKGFWIYFDINDLIGALSTSGTSNITDEGGISEEYTTSPDTYVYAHFDPSGIPSPVGGPSMPTGTTRYNCVVPVHTAVDAITATDYVDVT